MKPDLVIPALGTDAEMAGPLRTIEVQRDQLGKVIIVDDGSDPPLKPPPWCELLRIERPREHRGAGFARNEGFEKVTSDYVLFSDHSVYHHNDAFKSMRMALQTARKIRYWSIATVNTIFIDEPPGDDLEEMLQGLRDSERVTGTMEDPEFSMVVTEHTVALIPSELFSKLRRYDTDTFKHWGLEGTDFSLRVLSVGGKIITVYPRVSTMKNLFAYHVKHEKDDLDEPGRDPDRRNEEFVSKWGEMFSQRLYGNVVREANRILFGGGNDSR